MLTPAYKKILNEPEELRLICRKCRKDWLENRPKGYYVRYDKSGNFLIGISNPEEKKFFKCPDCNSRRVNRLAVKKIRKAIPSPLAAPSKE